MTDLADTKALNRGHPDDEDMHCVLSAPNAVTYDHLKLVGWDEERLKARVREMRDGRLDWIKLHWEGTHFGNSNWTPLKMEMIGKLHRTRVKRSSPRDALGYKGGTSLEEANTGPRPMTLQINDTVITQTDNYHSAQTTLGGGFKLSVGVEGELGIPLVASAKLSMSASGHFDHSRTDTVGASNKTSTTRSIHRSYTIDPGYKLVCSRHDTKYVIEIEYEQHFRIVGNVWTYGPPWNLDQPGRSPGTGNNWLMGINRVCGGPLEGKIIITTYEETKESGVTKSSVIPI